MTSFFRKENTELLTTEESEGIYWFILKACTTMRYKYAYSGSGKYLNARGTLLRPFSFHEAYVYLSNVDSNVDIRIEQQLTRTNEITIRSTR